MTPIAPLIEAFLNETLARQRGVSRHTRDSYALSFQLLFMFAAKRLKVSPSALTLEQLDAGLISAFLEYLEDKRKNAPVTRNVCIGLGDAGLGDAGLLAVAAEDALVDEHNSARDEMRVEAPEYMRLVRD